MEKKGSIKDFILTYAWAFLIIIAAIVAVSYYTVINPATVVLEKCNFAPEFICSGAPIANADEQVITLTLANAVGTGIENISAKSAGSANCRIGKASVDPLGNGATTELVLGTCSGLVTGELFADTVTITYINPKTGSATEVTGEIAGRAVVE